MIKLTKNIDEADFITHAGNFHADEVFSTVLLHKIYKNITLARVETYRDNETKIAYDIGFGKFDHHQHNYNKTRKKDFVRYCSFGLLWQEYGLKFLTDLKVAYPKDTFEFFDDLFVRQIDAVDNGDIDVELPVNIYTIDNLIALFRIQKDKSEEDNSFLEAVEFASIIFDKVLENIIYKVNNHHVLKEKIENAKNGVLILDEYIPFEYTIHKFKCDIDFVVYPSNRKGYAARTIATHYKGTKPKIPFPAIWGGLRKEELRQVSNIKTAEFCHNNLFLFISETLEDTLKAIEKTKKLS